MAFVKLRKDLKSSTVHLPALFFSPGTSALRGVSECSIFGAGKQDRSRARCIWGRSSTRSRSLWDIRQRGESGVAFLIQGDLYSSYVDDEIVRKISTKGAASSTPLTLFLILQNRPKAANLTVFAPLNFTCALSWERWATVTVSTAHCDLLFSVTCCLAMPSCPNHLHWYVWGNKLSNSHHHSNYWTQLWTLLYDSYIK